MPCRPPQFKGSWSKGGEVYPHLPPPIVGSWPNYAGTVGASSNKSKTKRIKGKGQLLGKNSSFNGVFLLGAIF